MALMTVKPSRWTLVFFAVLVLGLAANFGWSRREVQLVQRDTPPVHLARHALRCVLGRDTERYLWPRPADGDAAVWEAKIDERLRRLVSTPHGSDWPGRCVPLFDRLADRVRDDSRTLHVYRMAFELRDALLSFSRDPMAGMERVESGTLGAEMATFAMAVSSISVGAEAGWSSDLAPAPTDLWPVDVAAPPAPWLLPTEADYATLAQPDLLLYQSALDRGLRVVTFDAQERGRERALGPGAPVRSAPRDGAVLIASDSGDEVFLPGGEPATRVALPDPVRLGAQGTGLWQTALTRESLWLLTEDAGTLRLWRTPRGGDGAWGSPVGTLGARDVMLGGALAPDDSGRDAVTLATVRRGARGVLLERSSWEATTNGTNPTNGTDAPSPPVATVLGTELPAFDPHLLSCSAGAVQYLLVTSDESITVARVQGQTSSRLELWYTTWGAPKGSRFDITCNAHGLLLFADLANRLGSLVYFDFERNEHRTVNPPVWGPGARVLAGALTEHHGIVAVVKNAFSVRAYRSRPGSESEEASAAWEGGALLALHEGPPPAPTPNGQSALDAFPWDVGAATSYGDQVALLVQVPMSGRLVVGRIASRDGGATWR